MSDEEQDREFRADERHLYKPPPCPNCGSTNVRVDWVKVDTPLVEVKYIPGNHHCRDCRGLQR